MKSHKQISLCTAACCMLHVALCTLFTACAKDIGNYDYTDKEEIKIEGILPSYTCLMGIDTLNVVPTVISAFDGTLTVANSRYQYVYQRHTSDGWTDVEEGMELHMPMKLGEGKHDFRFVVTDKDTGFAAYHRFKVQSITQTSEGWLVLCEEDDHRVRLDMVSQFAMGDYHAIHPALEMDENLEPLYNAKRLCSYADLSAWSFKFFMTTGTDSYLIPCASNRGGSLQKLKESHEIKASLFMARSSDHIVNLQTIPGGGINIYRHPAVLAVTEEGNAYCWKTATQNTMFELPINTTTRGEDPEYRLSPWIGSTLRRPFDGDYASALLYDIDNKRFVGFDTDGQEFKWQVTYPLQDSPGDEFSYQTGMDLVCMINTAFSGGITYCIMQDGNKRVIYAIDVTSKAFYKAGRFTDIKAPHFHDASHYAASSQYPVIYYSHKNIVYAYNFATQEYSEALKLADSEEVTMIKFCRYDFSGGTSMLTTKLASEDANVYWTRENELVVGSYDSSKASAGKGVLRFCNAYDNPMQLMFDPKMVFGDFGRIADVIYKEVSYVS